jgi:hypothetical protein
MKNIKEGTWTKTEREFYKLILERDENWAARNEASARGLPTDDLSEKIRATIKAFCSVSIEMRGSRFTRGLGNGGGLDDEEVSYRIYMSMYNYLKKLFVPENMKYEEDTYRTSDLLHEKCFSLVYKYNHLFE